MFRPPLPDNPDPRRRAYLTAADPYHDLHDALDRIHWHSEAH